MTQVVGGSRRKTKSIFSVSKKEKGKTSLGRFLQKFNTGDRVVFHAVPSVHKSLYFRRFHGRIGIVVKTIGRNCEVRVRDKNKEKIIVTKAVHLVKVKNGT